MTTTRARWGRITVAASLATVLAAAGSTAAQAATTIDGGWVGAPEARTGKPLRLSGAVSATRGTVRVERLVSGRWRVASRVAVDRRGRWSARVVAPSTPMQARYRLVWTSGSATVTKSLPSVDVYRLNTYSVETRGRVRSDVDAVAAFAKATYADPRGWRRAHQRFARVRSGGNFTLVLAEASRVPRFSSTCSALYSCRVGRYVILNDTPWRKKTPRFSGSLTAYRRMVVNHETGHWLGLQHRYCGAKGTAAPVMQQQSKGMQGCTANSWPLASEIAALR